MVDGNERLLPAPELIVVQPIEFAAPKDYRPYWYATGCREFQDRIREIVDFAHTWTIPLFDELTSPESLITAYLQEDDRLVKQPHWYLYVVAAYDLVGMREEARKVLEMKFGTLGLRKDYSVAFENFGLSNISSR